MARIQPGRLMFSPRGDGGFGRRGVTRDIDVTWVANSGRRPTAREGWGLNPGATIYRVVTREGALDWAVVADFPTQVRDALDPQGGDTTRAVGLDSVYTEGHGWLSAKAIAATRRRAIRWLGVGALSVLAAVAFFVAVDMRDSQTLRQGAQENGDIVGLISPASWNFMDSGRIVVRYGPPESPRTARIWIDNELASYRIGQDVEVFVRGDHVRTKLEPNDPAPLGLLGVIVALLGLIGLVRGIVLIRH